MSKPRRTHMPFLMDARGIISFKRHWSAVLNQNGKVEDGENESYEADVMEKLVQTIDKLLDERT